CACANIGSQPRRRYHLELGTWARNDIYGYATDGCAGFHEEKAELSDGKPVTIIMIEDDEGHARLIEKNIRRAGVNNPVLPFTSGNEALDYLMGKDRSGSVSAGRHMLILLDLNLP